MKKNIATSAQDQNKTPASETAIGSKPLDVYLAKAPSQQLPIQRKLAIGAINDPMEHEADAMADKVMRMPEPGAKTTPGKNNFIQRRCNHCEEEENDGIAQRKPLVSFIQKKETTSASISTSDGVTNQINTTKGNGSGMENQTRSFMESRFGTSFQDVRIHTGSYASELSQQLNARAFTVGNDIYFNSGQYEPHTYTGKHLLAHELTHTVQQGDFDTIRKWDFTHLPEDEQNAYYEAKAQGEFLSVLARMEKGELDDNDLKNPRLYNRLTGLTTAQINALITKIKAYQEKNPKVVTTKILEFLEVRTQIATPMPEDAAVNRDVVTNDISSYSLTLNKVNIKVVADSFGNPQNETGPTTNFGKSFKWETSPSGIVTKFTRTDLGSDVDLNPTQLEVTIQTNYKDAPGRDKDSSYGKGTTQFDKDEKTTTLRVHEGQHGTDYINFIRHNALPVDISKGLVGLTEKQLKSVLAYIKNIASETCAHTDQVGITQNEFLKTPEGKQSGITSCSP